LRETNRVEFGVRSFTTWLGVAVDLLIPFAFGGAWVLILVFSADIVEAAMNAKQAQR
jgi:hypothetical protein